MIKIYLFILFMMFMLNNKILSFYYNLCFLLSFMYLFMYNFMNKSMWISMSNYFGMDYYSFFLILLSLWIFGLMYMSLSNQNLLKKILIFLLMMFLMIMLFSVNNLLLFYLFFEISLIPTFMLIVYWGYNPERIMAAFYMLMYTLLISLPLLIYLFKLYKEFSSFNMSLMLLLNQDYLELNIFEYIMYMLAFWIKLPMYLFHIWLPKAHVEAPVYGSMVLAAILLKLGGYGILRLSMILYKYTLKFNYMIISIGVIGSLIVAMICMGQIDLKSLVAYSSIVHMNLMMSAIMIMLKLGVIGGYIMMISHGLCSSGLFYMVNMYYYRTSSRLMFFNKGLLNIMPMMMMWWFILCIINFSFPLSLNFVSEIFMISVIMKWEFSLIYMLMMISLFSCSYSLYMFSYIYHGEIYLEKKFDSGNSKEMIVLILHIMPLIFMLLNLMLWI